MVAGLCSFTASAQRRLRSGCAGRKWKQRGDAFKNVAGREGEREREEMGGVEGNFDCFQEEGLDQRPTVVGKASRGKKLTHRGLWSLGSRNRGGLTLGDKGRPCLRSAS